MEVTLFGMVTEVREEQPLKAEPPMELTLFGMVTEDREEQLSKAEPQIVVIPLGMVYAPSLDLGM